MRLSIVVLVLLALAGCAPVEDTGDPPNILVNVKLKEGGAATYAGDVEIAHQTDWTLVNVDGQKRGEFPDYNISWITLQDVVEAQPQEDVELKRLQKENEVLRKAAAAAASEVEEGDAPQDTD